MCEPIVICQLSIKPPSPSFVTISTKHSHDLQLRLGVKAATLLRHDVLFQDVQGATVNNCEAGKNHGLPQAIGPHNRTNACSC